MQCSDLKHCDTDLYENTRICTGKKPDINEDAIELRTTEEQYEELRFVPRDGACRNINDENKTKAIRWKDEPKQIRYSIYALSLMTITLYSIVIAAAVVIYVPKGEVDRTWTLWTVWSNCDATCDNGTQTRLRFCYSPFGSSAQLDCEGSSIESRQCEKDPCPDHKVSFLATGTSAENSSNVIKFPSITFNSGNGYSSSTGRFTCKIPGIYNFAVTLTKVRRDIDLISAILRINGKSKLKLYSDPSDTGDIDYGSYSLSVTGNFRLSTNDYVDVQSTPNNFFSDYRTSFTGVLVIPDN